MAKKKYYVVWVGNKPGIYESWDECQAQIKGFPNARYKAFASKAEAEAAFKGASGNYIGATKTAAPKIVDAKSKTEINWSGIAVDAACSGNPGIMEYRGVELKTGKEIFHQGPFHAATNNLGEFLALVHGLAYLQQRGLHDLPIYSDSKIAIKWIKDKQMRSNVVRSGANRKVFELVDRAVDWLKTNSYKNPILKWETEKWGEIPADFGRK